MNEKDTRFSEKGQTMRRWPARLIACVVIVAVGVLIAFVLNKTAPKAKRKPPVKMSPLVRTMPLHPTSEQIIVPAKGVVKAANEVSLKAAVSGEILKIHPHFSEGGYLAKGEEILTIDPTDYQLAVTQKKQRVADAQLALELEIGHQDVAQKEWALLYGEIGTEEAESSLALRKPHLAKVKTDLEAARAELARAEVDLSRTRIIAPFNALIKTKNVDLGARIAAQESLAELVGTDLFWVQVSLPSERLRYIAIPTSPGQKGAAARIYYRNDQMRQGKVTRILPDLSQAGRMARLLIAVTDPLGRKAKKKKAQPLLIGEYVRVEIDGERLENVFVIPRTALKNDNQIWLADEQNRLQIRTVQTVWRQKDSVFVRDGLKDGDRLIVSELATPVNGMSLQIANGKKGKPAK